MSQNLADIDSFGTMFLRFSPKPGRENDCHAPPWDDSNSDKYGRKFTPLIKSDDIFTRLKPDELTLATFTDIKTT